MSTEQFQKLALISASLWFWTVVLMIFLPHIEQTLGGLFALPAAFAALAVLFVLYHKDGGLLSQARPATIYLAAGILAFITGLAAHNLIVEVSLLTMAAVLLSVALAVLSNFTPRQAWPKLRSISIGIMLASVGLLAVIELISGLGAGSR